MVTVLRSLNWKDQSDKRENPRTVMGEDGKFKNIDSSAYKFINNFNNK